MSEQFNRDELEVLAFNGETHTERALARMLLAGMDSEPVAVENFLSAMEGIGHIRRTLDETFGGLHGTHCEPDVLSECKAICDSICEAYRRTAPPAPLAVPETLIAELLSIAKTAAEEADEYGHYEFNDDSESHTKAIAEWEQRAAMLKAGPVTAATVPDGWKLVPVDLTGDMTNAMTDAILDDLHNVDVWRSVLAAVPAAPEQEV